MAIRALRSGPASNRAPPLPRALSTSASFSVAFGGASGCGCAGAVNRTVPIPACAAGTAGLTPSARGHTRTTTPRPFPKEHSSRTRRLSDRTPGAAARARPTSTPARRRRLPARIPSTPPRTPLQPPPSPRGPPSPSPRRLRVHRFDPLAVARASSASRRRREVDARWRSTAEARPSSVRDARQLCTSASGSERVRSPRGVVARGRGDGRGSRGRSRPSAAMLASIALDGGSAVASPRAGSRTSRFRSPSRNANWRSRLGRRDDSEVNATPWSQPSGTTGWDGTGRSVGGDATRARGNRGWTISRASRRVLTRAAKRARDVPMMVLGEAKGAPCWWWASRATCCGWVFIRSSRLFADEQALDALQLLCAVFGEPTHGAAPRVVPQTSLASVPSSRAG